MNPPTGATALAARPRLAAALATTILFAATLAACGDSGSSATSAGSGAAPSAPSAAALPAPAAPDKHPPRQATGSAAALSHDGAQVFVAGEDHDVVFVAPASFADPLSVRVVPMPGPPAQLVVAGNLVLVTVRTVPTDDAKAARDEIRGPLTDASRSRRLATESLSDAAYRTRTLAPADYKKYLEDGEIAPAGPPRTKPTAPPSPSTSARPGGSGTSSAKAPPRKPPVSSSASAQAVTKPDPTWKSFDPAVVRKSTGGLLLWMKPDPERGLVEAGRLVLPADAWGLALTPDGSRAVVTSAWTHQISVIDVDTKKVIATLPSSREPRGVTITADGKTAFVAHLVGADLTRVDDLDGAPRISAQPLPTAASRTRETMPLHASLGYSLTLSPDGASLYVPRHAVGADGHDAWWGAPTVDVLNLKTGKPLAPFSQPKSPANAVNAEGLRGDRFYLAAPGTSPQVLDALAQPRAVVYRKKTDSLLVAGEGYDTVLELDALAPDPSMFVHRALMLAIYDTYGQHPIRGGAPAAIVLTPDEDTAYVYCSSTFDLVKVNLATEKSEWLRLAEDGLPDALAKGRRLFRNARSTELSGGLGCAACHPEGRDDGYVWRVLSFDGEAAGFFVGMPWHLKSMIFSNPPEGFLPRQTPMLAGRVRAAGPYGWRGKSANLVERIREGTELHRGNWWYAGIYDDLGPYLGKIDALARYARYGLLPPPTVARPLTDVEKRGKDIFDSAEAQCAKCHVPTSDFTDRAVLPLRALPAAPGFVAERDAAYKTPSLLFVGETAPYYHDGSQPTLESLVKNNGSRMGQTSHLSPDDQAALVAYLRTL